jgi:hypothetical protein
LERLSDFSSEQQRRNEEDFKKSLFKGEIRRLVVNMSVGHNSSGGCGHMGTGVWRPEKKKLEAQRPKAKR